MKKDYEFIQANFIRDSFPLHITLSFLPVRFFGFYSHRHFPNSVFDEVRR